MKKETILNLIKKWIGLSPKRDIPSILEQDVNFKTIVPDQYFDFNDWAQKMKVSCYCPK